MLEDDEDVASQYISRHDTATATHSRARTVALSGPLCPRSAGPGGPAPARQVRATRRTLIGRSAAARAQSHPIGRPQSRLPVR